MDARLLTHSEVANPEEIKQESDNGVNACEHLENFFLKACQ